VKCAFFHASPLHSSYGFCVRSECLLAFG
jgi:hypothetical protein